MHIGSRSGPGGGSLPEWIMRAGAISPMAPSSARRDIEAPEVIRTTRLPTGTTYTTSSGMQIMGVSLGHDANGQHVREFPAGNRAATVEEARGAVAAVRQAAKFLRDHISDPRVATMSPALVGGPIAALARGEAVVLRWPNGVAVKATL